MFRKSFFFLLISISLQAYSKNLLIIGDSHGALPLGWVHQLTELRKGDSVFNLAISGNTIGFQNNGQDTLNTLNNIDSYFERAERRFKRIDMVIILLGTNDCKSVFASRTDEVKENLKTLLAKMYNHFNQNEKPRFVYVSPPPMADDEFLTEKYTGGNNRLKELLKDIKLQTKTNHFELVDIFHPLWNERNTLTADGVHYKPEGYVKIARLIQKKLQ